MSLDDWDFDAPNDGLIIAKRKNTPGTNYSVNNLKITVSQGASKNDDELIFYVDDKMFKLDINFMEKLLNSIGYDLVFFDEDD